MKTTIINLPQLLFWTVSCCLLWCCCCQAHEHQETLEQQRHAAAAEAARRLVKAALAAPGASTQMESLLQDIQIAIRPEIRPSDEEVEELMREVVVVDDDDVSTPSCDSHLVQQENDDDTELTGLPEYADHHVIRVNDIVNDFDCMEREFDASDPDFDSEEAAEVLAKCRLLVVRNVFSAQVIEEHKADVTEYINDLHYGRISRHGKTAVGDNGFIVMRSAKRFDVLYPRYMLNEAMTTNPNVLSILQNQQVLGEEVMANAVGAVLAESGAKTGKFHYDDELLFEKDSFEACGIAGSDIPPYAVTQFTPLQNTTMDHGPTEFCMGTNFLKGLRTEPYVSDERLIAKGTPFYELSHFEDEKEECPKRFRRTPLSNIGDVIFFDYTITHRGGGNVSPDLRAMSYVFYSRPWFKDWNFDDYNIEKYKKKAESYPLLKRMTLATKFAEADESDYDEDEEQHQQQQPLESIQNFLKPKGSVTISNRDVEGASLYLEDTRLRPIGVDEEVTLTLPLRTSLRAVNERNGDELGSWIIQSRPSSIVLTMAAGAP